MQHIWALSTVPFAIEYIPICDALLQMGIYSIEGGTVYEARKKTNSVFIMTDLFYNHINSAKKGKTVYKGTALLLLNGFHQSSLVL